MPSTWWMPTWRSSCPSVSTTWSGSAPTSRRSDARRPASSGAAGRPSSARVPCRGRSWTCARDAGADLRLFGRDFDGRENADGSWDYRDAAGVLPGLPAPALGGGVQVANAAATLAALRALGQRLPLTAPGHRARPAQREPAGALPAHRRGGRLRVGARRRPQPGFGAGAGGQPGALPRSGAHDRRVRDACGQGRGVGRGDPARPRGRLDRGRYRWAARARRCGARGAGRRAWRRHGPRRHRARGAGARRRGRTPAATASSCSVRSTPSGQRSSTSVEHGHTAINPHSAYNFRPWTTR